MSQIRAKGSPTNNERFTTIPNQRGQRSMFDRSHSHKTTIESGLLYPIFVDEVLPGDSINLTPAFFARMATPIQPFMDGLYLDYQFFFTPLRLLWDNFVRMMGERPAPADHNDYTVPQMVAPASVGHLVGSLSDYLTLPTDIADYTHSSLFHRNYNLVHREWYRDENLQDPVVVDMDNGPDDSTDYVLLRRGKRKDYFSGALPFAQKGASVLLPLGDTAPLQTVGDGIPTFDNGVSVGFNLRTQSGTSALWGNPTPSTTGDAEWNDPKLEVDLSAAVGGTINDMRQAIAVQQLLERDARGGSRYRELVYSHFGVETDDIRLMRPEVLATGSIPVNVSPVSQTTPDVSSFTYVGNLGAFVTASQVGRGFVKNFTEHGIVMGLASVRAELGYQQGLNRMFSRKTRYEFFWPELAHLGEQAVQSREIYTDGTGVEADETGDFSIWGYQPRYEEYRHRQSIITGELRSTYSASLDVWHLGQDFGARPVLNAAYIEENPPVTRILSLSNNPEFILDCYFNIKHVRPMPKYGTPGLTRF